MINPLDRIASQKFPEKQFKVCIHSEDYKALPFGKLQSRNGAAIVFSYFDFSSSVSDFMQKGSHLTRIYFINANKLKGFIIAPTITAILKNVRPRLKEFSRYQEINL